MNTTAAGIYKKDKKEFKAKYEKVVKKYANANDFGNQTKQGITSGIHFYYV